MTALRLANNFCLILTDVHYKHKSVLEKSVTKTMEGTKPYLRKRSLEGIAYTRDRQPFERSVPVYDYLIILRAKHFLFDCHCPLPDFYK